MRDNWKSTPVDLSSSSSQKIKGEPSDCGASKTDDNFYVQWMDGDAEWLKAFIVK